MDIKNPEYVKLHGDYKNLVDFMLGSFMEEMQITPAKFEMACLEGRNQQRQAAVEGLTNPRAFHQRLFQQIWAANDIRIFVRMMTQRNVELQLQALDLIERRQLSTEEGASGSAGGGEGEISTDASDLIEFNDQGGHAALIETNSEELLDHLDLPKEDEPLGHVDDEEGAKTDADGNSAVGGPEKEISDKFERLNLFFKKEQVDEEEVKQRQDYLRAQRDKILEIKKRTRARQLNESVTTVKRPGSAQAAQKILAGQEVDTLMDDGPSESSLILRRVLAKRLREEVVDGQAKAGD